MTAVTGTSPEVPALLAIGAAAEQAGVSPRTLRWYEELELLAPAGHSAGGARRYSQDDLARIVHIRELQSLLGFDLGEIRDILRGEDDLAGLRDEYRAGTDRGRRREILLESSAINHKLRSVVAGKQERLAGMMGELLEKSARYTELLEEMEEPAADPG
ncbi:MAG: MerR family transcriptional regulator [Acidimicrobiales bacterium]